MIDDDDPGSLDLASRAYALLYQEGGHGRSPTALSLGV